MSINTFTSCLDIYSLGANVTSDLAQIHNAALVITVPINIKNACDIKFK